MLKENQPSKVAQTWKVSALAVNSLSRCCVTMHLHVACSPQRRNPVNSSKQALSSCCDDVCNEDNETAMPVRCAMIESRHFYTTASSNVDLNLPTNFPNLLFVSRKRNSKEKVWKKSSTIDSKDCYCYCHCRCWKVEETISQHWASPSYVNAKRKIITRNEVNKARKASPICIIVTLLLR